MLITRTPLRISIGGGGTDLPSYYEQFGGFVIAAAITKYVYIGINRTFTDDYFLKYSALERVRTVDEIEHPIIREALKAPRRSAGARDREHGRHPRRDRAGLVGNVHRRAASRAARLPAPARLRRGGWPRRRASIEIEELDRPVGKQDQYIAAFGGLTCFEFIATDGPGWTSLRIREHRRRCTTSRTTC